MTVQDKILESEFFLDKIRQEYSKQTDVRHYFSAFLSSARSIGEHLLEEYNQKYSLGISLEDRLDAGIFRRIARKQNNNNAIQFIQWFDNQIDRIKQDQAGALWEKRNLNIHRETSRPNKIVVEITENVNTGAGSSSVRWCFQDIPNMDVLSLCEQFLVLMKALVTQARSVFP